MQTFASEIRKAAKEHTCAPCNAPIWKGETYHTWMTEDGGSVWRIRAHGDCALMLSHVCPESFSPDDWQEFREECEARFPPPFPWTGDTPHG